MSIQSEAIIVDLDVKTWSGEVVDSTVTSEVAELKNASGGRAAGKYVKKLVDASELRDIHSVASQARRLNEAMTVPWERNHDRLLPNTLAEKYISNMDELAAKMVKARATFLERYPQIIEDAKARLGDMFREEDYPSAQEIAKRFDVSYTMRPVEDPDAFMVQVSERHAKAMVEQLEKSIAEKSDAALMSLYQRLDGALKAIDDKLDRYDNAGEPRVFRDSLVTNLSDLLELLPQLNLFNSDELTEAHIKLTKAFNNVQPDELRARSDQYDEAKAERASDTVNEVRNDLAEAMAGLTG